MIRRVPGKKPSLHVPVNSLLHPKVQERLSYHAGGFTVFVAPWELSRVLTPLLETHDLGDSQGLSRVCHLCLPGLGPPETNYT